MIEIKKNKKYICFIESILFTFPGGGAANLSRFHVSLKGHTVHTVHIVTLILLSSVHRNQKTMKVKHQIVRQSQFSQSTLKCHKTLAWHFYPHQPILFFVEADMKLDN